ncbi:MAG: ABC transporter ATP-binding protein [Clostridium sp.]|nr:ABC transporter ATP-binding protein [Clostridium sp.]
MLDIKNITFGYARGIPVLTDFNFRIGEGGVYGLLGRNGAGKSTLLYLISGLLTPQQGSVEFDGVNTRRRLPSTLSEIFILPEEFTLPSIPLDRYIKLYAPLYPRFSRGEMDRYLAMFEMGDSSRIHLGALSMGQKKKVYMSFALACNTRLLLMDEPSNGLDIPGKSAFRRVIGAAAADTGRIIIISTHQVRDIDRILDHIVIMDNHRVILDAPVGEILGRLAFVNTADPSRYPGCLYMIPSIGGASIVIENDGETETDLNLETLFIYALENPAQIGEIFSRKRETGDEKDELPPYIPNLQQEGRL